MREVHIDAEPHHSLRGWQAFRIGDSIVLSGREAADHGPFEEMGSRAIEFFDSERAICMDANGDLWHIPANQVMCQDFVECTSEILDLLAEPRSEREIEPMTPAEEVLLKILAATRE
jgi:hypothetical protein